MPLLASRRLRARRREAFNPRASRKYANNGIATRRSNSADAKIDRGLPDGRTTNQAAPGAEPSR
jgi:hypothetical protein